MDSTITYYSLLIFVLKADFKKLNTLIGEHEKFSILLYKEASKKIDSSPESITYISGCTANCLTSFESLSFLSKSAIEKINKHLNSSYIEAKQRIKVYNDNPRVPLKNLEKRYAEAIDSFLNSEYINETKTNQNDSQGFMAKVTHSFLKKILK